MKLTEIKQKIMKIELDDGSQYTDTATAFYASLRAYVKSNGVDKLMMKDIYGGLAHAVSASNKKLRGIYYDVKNYEGEYMNKAMTPEEVLKSYSHLR